MPRIAFWKFSEPADPILPSDSVGSYDDLAVPAGLSEPPVDFVGVTGIARVFSDPTGYEAAEASGVDVLLRRSVSVQAIVEFDRDAQAAAGVPGSIVSLGFRDSGAEDLQFLLELEAGPSGFGRILMQWETGGGTLTANSGALFRLPALGFIVFTAVRDWRSDSLVIVRYYANDIFLGREEVTAGDIDGTAGATILVGVRGDGAGGHENHLEGTVDQILVRDDPMTAEEIRQIYRRIAVHQPSAYEILKELLPEGVYSTDPDSIVQRELFVEAQGVAAALSKAFEIREDFLPDRAWSFLDRWETVLGLSPGPLSTILERRNAILSHLRAVQGHSVPQIKEAMSPTFDLPPEDIVVQEYDNFLNDDFATAVADFWEVIEAAHPVGVVVTGGELVITSQNGTNQQWQTASNPHLRAVVDGDAQVAEPSLDAEMSLKIVSEGLVAVSDTVGGLYFANLASNDATFVGIFDDGTIKIGSTSIVNGVQSALVDHGAAPALPFFLNLKFIGGTSYQVATAPSGDRTDLTPVATISGLALPLTGGIGHVGTLGNPSPAGDDDVNYDDFQMFTPNGIRSFFWFAFRDPNLPGDPDMPAANQVIQRIKPAHTIAGATQSLAAATDDPFSLADFTPLV